MTKQDVWEWVVSILTGVVAWAFISMFIVCLYTIDGSSMQPTLQSQERVLVNRLVYKFREPQKNEIIIFEYQRNRERDFVKRVIATGGDTIEITDGKVYVNDQLLEENYILDTTNTEYPRITVPQGTVFVMGDNRQNSSDSRFAEVGFVSLDLIQGRAEAIVWPFSGVKALP